MLSYCYNLCVCHSYAPWCPACQQLQSVWKEFADWSEDIGVSIAKVDVTEQPGELLLLFLLTLSFAIQCVCFRRDHVHHMFDLVAGLSGRFIITALPTIYQCVHAVCDT